MCFCGIKQSRSAWLFLLGDFLLLIYVDDILVMSKQSRPVKDLEICWSLNSIAKSSSRQYTYWVSVWVCKVWDFTIVRTFSFHKETNSTPSMEPHSTATKFLESKDAKFDRHLYPNSMKIWCNLLSGANLIFPIPCAWFPNSFQDQLEDTGLLLEK
jgi:hypothetical protein